MQHSATTIAATSTTSHTIFEFLRFEPPLLFAILRKVVLEIPLLFLMNKLFPLYGLPYAQVITEFLLAIAAVVMLLRIFRKEASVQS